MPVGTQSFVEIRTKLWLAVSVTERTQNRGIPCAAADWATPPASISTAEAPEARKAAFSAAVCATWSMEASTPVACGISEYGRRTVEPAARGIHRRSHENIADFQRRIQRSTESHTDNRFRPARRAGYLNGPGGMRRARAIRHHPQLPAADSPDRAQ
jgi:hypothetical protein